MSARTERLKRMYDRSTEEIRRLEARAQGDSGQGLADLLRLERENRRRIEGDLQASQGMDEEEERKHRKRTDEAKQGEVPDAIFAPAMAVLKAAIRAVPAVKYALGVAGLAAASALVGAFTGGVENAPQALVIVLVFMVLLLLFSYLAVTKDAGIRLPALALVWLVLFLGGAWGSLTLTTNFFDWPRPGSRGSVFPVLTQLRASADGKGGGVGTLTVVPPGEPVPVARPETRCERPLQPYRERCVTQAMADYLSCVEATGGNLDSLFETRGKSSELAGGVSGGVRGPTINVDVAAQANRDAQDAEAIQKRWQKNDCLEFVKVVQAAGRNALQPPPKRKETRASVGAECFAQLDAKACKRLLTIECHPEEGRGYLEGRNDVAIRMAEASCAKENYNAAEMEKTLGQLDAMCGSVLEKPELEILHTSLRNALRARSWAFNASVLTGVTFRDPPAGADAKARKDHVSRQQACVDLATRVWQLVYAGTHGGYFAVPPAQAGPR